MLPVMHQSQLELAQQLWQAYRQVLLAQIS